MYLFILALMRIFRREAGSLSIPDLLVVVLVADAAHNGMSAEYRSITEAVVLVGRFPLELRARFPVVPLAGDLSPIASRSAATRPERPDPAAQSQV